MERLQKVIAKKNGFSLVELLVVVAIVGVLASVGIFTYSGYVKSARATVLKSYHSDMINILKREITNCEIGEKYYLVDRTCPLNQHQIVKGLLYNFNKETPFWNHGATSSGLLKSSKNFSFGHIALESISENGSPGVVLRSCWEVDCQAEDTKETKLTF